MTWQKVDDTRSNNRLILRHICENHAQPVTVTDACLCKQILFLHVWITRKIDCEIRKTLVRKIRKNRAGKTCTYPSDHGIEIGSSKQWDWNINRLKVDGADKASLFRGSRRLYLYFIEKYYSKRVTWLFSIFLIDIFSMSSTNLRPHDSWVARRYANCNGGSNQNWRF